MLISSMDVALAPSVAKYLCHDGVVVDDPVAFNNVRDTIHAIAIGNSQVFIGKMLVQLGVLQIGGVIFPVLVADRVH